MEVAEAESDGGAPVSSLRTFEACCAARRASPGWALSRTRGGRSAFASSNHGASGSSPVRSTATAGVPSTSRVPSAASPIRAEDPVHAETKNRAAWTMWCGRWLAATSSHRSVAVRGSAASCSHRSRKVVASWLTATRCGLYEPLARRSAEPGHSASVPSVGSASALRAIRATWSRAARSASSDGSRNSRTPGLTASTVGPARRT